MAITITFDDYDTVCYSSLHNLIKLIEHSVGLSVEVNITSDKVDSMKADVDSAAQEAHDAFLLSQNLNVRVSTNTANINHILDYDGTFLNSELGQQILDMNKRIRDLENA